MLQLVVHKMNTVFYGFRFSIVMVNAPNLTQI